ncbi:MAG: hypothetical protein JST76_05550 [Bacteroidetes bacterium]|nr:hypothetical protein [Bacteroidota bacterium]
MSRGFTREYEDQWLHEIPPTMSALIQYLTRENNGIPVYERRTYTDPTSGREVHEMSNSLSYAVDEKNQWYMLE